MWSKYYCWSSAKNIGEIFVTRYMSGTAITGHEYLENGDTFFILRTRHEYTVEELLSKLLVDDVYMITKDCPANFDWTIVRSDKDAIRQLLKI